MKIIGIVALACIAGCASTTIKEVSQVTLKTGQVPAMGSAATASVGSAVFSQFHYWSKTGFQLGDSASVRIGLGRVAVAAGAFVSLAEVEGERAYCTEGLAYSDPIAGPFKVACFVDRDNDGRFEIVKAAPGMIWFETKLQSPISYAKGEEVRPSADSKKMELLYQGFAGKTIKLSYREYVNDMARPAFFQDASYEIDGFPAEIAFKAARIKVLSAGNSGMSYIVLSSF